MFIIHVYSLLFLYSYVHTFIIVFTNVTLHPLPSCHPAGVKQPPIETLIAGKTYVVFSHTIKAQPENMPLLDAVLEKVHCTLYTESMLAHTFYATVMISNKYVFTMYRVVQNFPGAQVSWISVLKHFADQGSRILLASIIMAF